MNIETVRTDNWHDVDHPWDLHKLNRYILKRIEKTISSKAEIAESVTIEGDVQIGPGTIIHPGCVIQGPVHIAGNCDDFVACRSCRRRFSPQKHINMI